MSQDIVADAMNQMMNAKRAHKESVVISRVSKLLFKILDIMKQSGHIDYKTEDDLLKVQLLELNECRAVKPRYTIDKNSIDKYVRRFLPSRKFGYVVISTSRGLMTHKDAQEKKTGGCIIAYFY